MGIKPELKTRISRRMGWDMGHRVPDHESLCRNLHGHRYIMEVIIEGPVIEGEGKPDRGMVMDFGHLKQSMKGIADSLDHSFMVFKDDPLAGALALFSKHEGERTFHLNYPPLKIAEVDFIPTAEKIAEFIFKRLIFSSNLSVVEVTVWETPNCKATVSI